MAGRRRRRRGRTADCKPRGDLVPRKMKGNYRAPNVTQIEKGQSKHTQRWTLSCVAPLHSAFRPTPSRERKKNKTKENRLRSPRKITKVVQVPPPPSMKIIFVFVFFIFYSSFFVSCRVRWVCRVRPLLGGGFFFKFCVLCVVCCCCVPRGSNKSARVDRPSGRLECMASTRPPKFRGNTSVIPSAVKKKSAFPRSVSKRNDQNERQRRETGRRIGWLKNKLKKKLQLREAVWFRVARI